MRFRIRSSAVLLLLPLLGCSEAPNEATCRTSTAPAQGHSRSICLIPGGFNQVMMLRDDTNMVTLPMADTANASNEQCTLHQHIWRQTGINVEVGRLLISTPHNTGIYACFEQAGLAAIDSSFPSPQWANPKLEWVKQDPFVLTEQEMADKDLLVPIRDALIRFQQQSKRKLNQ